MARQPPPSCPFTVRNTHKPQQQATSRRLSVANVLGLPPGVEVPGPLARQLWYLLLVMSRFVGATSVAGGDRHTITAWMPSAARLAFVKATQSRGTVALPPLGSEQGVVCSAGQRRSSLRGGLICAAEASTWSSRACRRRPPRQRWRARDFARQLGPLARASFPAPPSTGPSSAAAPTMHPLHACGRVLLEPTANFSAAHAGLWAPAFSIARAAPRPG